MYETFDGAIRTRLLESEEASGAKTNTGFLPTKTQKL